jgi:hypothetical protein
MPRTPRLILLAAVTATTLLGAGCTQTTAGTALPVGAAGGADAAPATTDPVAWADGVCGAMSSFNAFANEDPHVDAADPAAALQTLSTTLGKAIAGSDSATTALGKAGKSPVAGGDKLVADLTTAVTAAKGAFTTLKGLVDDSDANDPEVLTSLRDPVDQMQQTLDALPDPTDDVTASPALSAAVAKAPTCKGVLATG